MPTGEIIKKLRKKYKMSADELAEAIGRDRATVYRYERGEIENVPSNIIKELAKVLKTTPAYLLEIDTKDEPSNLSPIPESQIKTIPIYSSLSCGRGIWVDEIPIDYIGVPKFMINRSVSYFANEADGDSMEPGIKNGDVLIFQVSNQVETGRIGAFSLNGQYYCKRLKQMPDGSNWLFSDNEQYDPIQIKPDDDFRTLGIYKLKLSKEQ